ncbi:hypothetical protein QQX98_012193 [Neonectria punicea]|uniref:SnoaL-like polyketide cyclase n=1 Tax=Neonectria punicea TaxID=979145 RepID=A0ABR1GJJ8_9HYPO
MSPARDVSQFFHSWLEAVNTRDWDSALDHLASEILHNEEAITAQTFLRKLQNNLAAMPDSKTESNLLVVDKHAGKIAARLTHFGTLVKPLRGVEVTGKQLEWSEYVFCEFGNGKICAWASLWDLAHRPSGISDRSSDRATDLNGDIDLENLYRRYIHSINTLKMAEHFPDCCQPQITHNGINLSIDEYRTFIESSFEEIKGLTFTIVKLVADKESQRLAARLEFTGRPMKEFRGIQPTGNEVNFSEHVIYELDEGKIARVWSVLDLDAYRASMES